MMESEGFRSLVTEYNDRRTSRIFDSIRRIVQDRIDGSTAAFWHPLGFFRLELGTDNDGLRYFLHFWPDGETVHTGSGLAEFIDMCGI